MIAYSPAHVFESMGAREQALFDAASPLMVRFEKICACIRASRSRSFQAVPKELTADFPTMLFEYVQPSVLEGLKARRCPPRDAAADTHRAQIHTLLCAELRTAPPLLLSA